MVQSKDIIITSACLPDGQLPWERSPGWRCGRRCAGNLKFFNFTTQFYQGKDQ